MLALPVALAIGLGLLSCIPGRDPDDELGEGIVITPDGLTLVVGSQDTLSAEVRDDSGNVVQDAEVIWSSQAALVAAVGDDGMVSGVSVGVTEVTAASGELEDTVDVIVLDQLTLEIEPDAATVEVGGTAQFRLVARDRAGNVVAGPPARWAAGNPAVGMVVGGLAVGMSAGTTPITASVAGLTSPPATLTVEGAALGCDGVEMVTEWQVDLTYSYEASLTNAENHEIEVAHSGDFTATLTPLGGILPASEWEGTIGGELTIDDADRDLNSTPNVYTTLRASGQPVTGFGSVFRLQIDWDACTYTFHVSPFVHATQTVVADITTVEEADLPVGVLQGGDVLGAWRELGMAEFDSSFDAYLAGIGALYAGPNAYFPMGIGPLLWAGADDIFAPQGAATVDYVITPQ